MIRRQLRQFCSRTSIKNHDLLLNEFARRHESQLLACQLSAYTRAKEEFDNLIEKYQIFAPKEASVAEAAKLVGLQLPKVHSKE